LTYLAGRRFFSARAAFLGAAILASSAEFIIMSRVVVHDIALAFFVTLSLFLFLLGYQTPRRRQALFLAGYASIGASVVAKGPIGLFIPVMIVGLFLIARRDLRFVKEMRIGRGLLIVLVVSSPWYILMALRNPDYLGYFFWQQNLGNFFSSVESRHPEPFYFYLPVLLGGLLPWSFFLAPAMLGGLRRRLCESAAPRCYLSIWVAAVFLFFSAAQSKLPTYILPLFPAAALLVGEWWDGLIDSARSARRRVLLALMVTMVAVAAAGAIFVLIFPLSDLERRYGVGPVYVNSLALMVFFWAAAGLLLSLRARYRSVFGSMVALVICGTLAFSGWLAPAIDPYRSTKEIGIQLDRILPPGEEMVFFRRIRESALFYGDRRARVIKPPEQETFFLADRPVYCIVRERDLEWFESMEGIYIVSRRGDRLLLSNRRLSEKSDR
jgi:4-amino-4-deoxy-L-arabinose transferase-like glycosyltransferase